MTSTHAFKPETTNGGACFADCSCGWAGGVHATRLIARQAWQAHQAGGDPVAPIPTVVLVGGRVVGQ